jgi:ribosomal protein S28E/S33
MPIRYELDDVHRRVVVTVHGPFQVDDILAIMARQRAEQTWTYGILYDLQGMTGEPTIAELRELMSEAARRHLGQAPRGPVALLATDPTLFDRLCTYAEFGRTAALTIAVFRDRAEAEQWLTDRTDERP